MGYYPHKKYKYGVVDTMVDSLGKRHENWVIGKEYDIKNLKDKSDINLNVTKKEIDGIEHEPYLMEFRETSKGYYLENIRKI